MTDTARQKCPMCHTLLTITIRCDHEKKIAELEKENARLEDENERIQTIGLSSRDFVQLLEWMKDWERDPATIEFAEGAAKDAARAFEKYLQSTESRRNRK